MKDENGSHQIVPGAGEVRVRPVPGQYRPRFQGLYFESMGIQRALEQSSADAAARIEAARRGRRPWQTVHAQKVVIANITVSDCAVIKASITTSVAAEIKQADHATEQEHSAVGSVMLEIATTLFSRKTCEHVFEPMIADYRLEYSQASNRRQQFFTVIRWGWGFFHAAVLSKILAAITVVMKALKGAG